MQSNSTGVAITNNGSTSLACVRTTDGGVSWASTSFTPAGGLAYGIKTAPTTGSYMYWISATANIYRSTDNGVTFSSQFTLTQPGLALYMYSVQAGWCGTQTGQIYHYTSSDPVGIQNINNQVPNNYSLSQNYPNPFNPTTTVKFNIAKTTNVSIKIYDITGRLVYNLVDQKMNAGKYDVKWTSINNNGQFVSSGVYFYRIEAGDFTDVKKMVLVK
jgi:hypothetical protein